MSENHCFQVLSLDGGGIRGVFSAAILAAVEEDAGTEITKHFDLIAGTSTGGIIAIALGMGIRPKEIVRFYVEQGPTIFGRQFGLAAVRQWFSRKYSAVPLENALRSILGGRLFGESASRLVIPSYNIGAGSVHVFRTPHLGKLGHDYRIPAWQVAMATSAAPTYFSAFRQIAGLRLVDGGVWANNPAMTAIVEAVGEENLGIDLADVAMLSISTLSGAPSYSRGLDKGGRLRWAPAAPDVILRGTSEGVHNQAQFLVGKERYFRLDPQIADERLELDRPTSVEELIAHAYEHSRKAMPQIRERFLGHTAAPYAPLHTVPAQEAA